MDLVECIKKLNKNSTEENIMEIVEFDFKALAEIENIYYKNVTDENDDLKFCNSEGINSIYNWFNWRKVNGKINPNEDQWRKEFAPDSTYSCKNLKKMYQDPNLGWWDNIPMFSCDAINSFITIYSFALHIYYKDKFKFDTSINSVRVANEKQIISEKYLLSVVTNGKSKYEEFEEVNKLPCIQELARLTHSFGNFMPCPNRPYNIVKGCSKDIKDFLDLMIIKIQNEIGIKYSVYEKGKYIHKNVGSQTMEMWKKWFDDNIEKIIIDYNDYQLLLSVDDINNIDSDLFVKIVSKINNRIKIRGIRMIKEINMCEEVKQKCDELIEKQKNNF